MSNESDNNMESNGVSKSNCPIIDVETEESASSASDALAGSKKNHAGVFLLNPTSTKRKTVNNGGRGRGNKRLLTGRGGRGGRPKRVTLFGKLPDKQTSPSNLPDETETDSPMEHAGVLPSGSANSSHEQAVAVIAGPSSTTSALSEIPTLPEKPMLKTPKKPKSVVWEYFEIDASDETKGKCKLCHKSIFRGRGTQQTTSSMSRHLKSVHCIDSKDEEESAGGTDNNPPKSYALPKMKQLDLHATLESGKQWDFNDPRSLQATKVICEMLVIDDLPWSLVEKQGFLRMIRHFSKKFKVPGRKYFSEKAFPEIARKAKAKVQSLINEARSISFTSDIWTSSNNHGFISLTAHWISPDYVTHNFLLSMSHFPGSHTANAIKEKLEKILAEWKIEKDRVHVIVRDNAPNIANGIEDAGLLGVACYIHTIQLIISDSVTSQRSVIDVLAKCRGVVSHVNRAQLISDRFSEMQNSKTSKVLVQDVPTRWNSSYYMIERFYELKPFVLLLLSEYDFTHNLTSNDWNLIRSLLALLKPFETVTRQFSSEHCFMSEIIPSICMLRSLLSIHDEAHYGLGTMKEEMLLSLNARFQPDTYEVNPALIYATLLDPRYKLAFFSTQHKRDEIRQSFFDCLVSNFEGSKTQAEADPSRLKARDSVEDAGGENVTKRAEQMIYDTYDKIVAEFESSQKSTETSSCSEILNAEINMYLNSPNLPVFTDSSRVKRNDPLVWWKYNVSNYPNIGKLVYKYLSSPASSVYSERLFSEAGNVYEVKRNSLLPDSVSDLVFLKHNLRLLNYDYE